MVVLVLVVLVAVLVVSSSLFRGTIAARWVALVREKAGCVRQRVALALALVMVLVWLDVVMAGKDDRLPTLVEANKETPAPDPELVGETPRRGIPRRGVSTKAFLGGRDVLASVVSAAASVATVVGLLEEEGADKEGVMEGVTAVVVAVAVAVVACVDDSPHRDCRTLSVGGGAISSSEHRDEKDELAVDKVDDETVFCRRNPCCCCCCARDSIFWYRCCLLPGTGSVTVRGWVVL